MPSTPEPHEQWYVLHVLSGQENSVRDRIIRKAKDAELSDFIYRVEVPTELISEVRNGKKTERHSKLFPGYVYANMYLLEADGTLNKDLWYFIQQIDGVISIAGSRNAPLPMRKREVGSSAPAGCGSRRRPSQGGIRRRRSRARLRRPVPEPGRHHRRNRPRKRQTARQRLHLWPRHSGGPGILAGGKSLSPIRRQAASFSRSFSPLTKQNHGKRNNQNHQAPDQCRSR